MQYKIPPDVEQEQEKALLSLYDTDKSRQLLSSYRSDATLEALLRAERIAQRFDTYTETTPEDTEEWDILKEKVQTHPDPKTLESTLFKTTANRIQLDNI